MGNLSRLGRAGMRGAIVFVVGVVLSGTASAQSAGSCALGVASDVALPACNAIISGQSLKGVDLANAYYVRSQIGSNRDDAPRQFSDLGEALRLDARNVPALIARGKMLRMRRELDRAQADFDAAIAAAPKNAEAFHQRALVMRDKGDADRAIADLTQSLQIDPNQFSGYTSRGGLYRDQKKFDAALVDFDAALKISPTDPGGILGRGRVLAEKKDLDGAYAAFSSVIAVNPNNGFAYFQRAYYNRRERQQALADYSEVVRINPRNSIAFNNRAVIKRGLKDWDGAIADYTRSLELDPGYTSAMTGRGLAYEAKGDIERAKADFNSALALPIRSADSKWAIDTARTRLATLAAPVARSAEGDLFGGPAAKKSDRIALVIGNGAYRNIARLANPAADARAVAASLRTLGFDVVDGFDLDRRGMDEKIVAFLRGVPSAKVALVFYAGHGVQIDGRNYLVPVDVNKIARATLSFELVDMDRVLSGLDDESRANIVLLDACRDDPLTSRSTSDRGLAADRGGLAGYSNVASGMLIGFATSPGKTANDGEGGHSPFTTALLKHMQAPVEVNEMLRQVRVDVFNDTKKQQLPWANSSLLGQVFLSAAGEKKPN